MASPMALRAPRSRAMRLAVLLLAVLAATAAAKGNKRNYYDVLGVGRDAGKRELKRAFRKLSLKYHPDKNPGDESAKDKFTEVAAAYETLSDPEKKRVYDQHGEEGLEELQKRGSGGGDPFDLFSQMGFNFGGRRKRRGGDDERRGEDVELPLRVTLEDIYNGREQPYKMRKQVLCPHCRGTGAKDPDKDIKKCRRCKGKGVVIERHQLGPGFVQQVQTPCRDCNGKGKIVTRKCPHCAGEKLIPGWSNLVLVIERGMPEGEKIVFENEADEHPDHNAGHLVFVVQTTPHARFTREGDDLRLHMRIPLLDALVGFSRDVEHLDGRTVTVTKGTVTRPDEVLTLKGEGMPQHNFASIKGDLHVQFSVEMPRHLTQDQKSGFERLLRGRGRGGRRRDEL